MTLLEEYLRELGRIRGSGAAVPETSFYLSLGNLLNAIGGGLKPKVRCILHPSHGDGFPDFGLWTAEQLRNGGSNEPPVGTKPSRGVVEVKSPSADVIAVADTAQVAKYWKEYRQVLVTNYCEFLLLGSDRDGKPVKLEQYQLAASEAGFWTAVAHPRGVGEAQGEAFVEFLKRVMLHAAALAAPKDVAWFMASYAREALRRIERRKAATTLSVVRGALEEALGIKFEDDKGEHFFRSTLIQTLFYGIFSAWVLWTRGRSPQDKARLDWRLAGQYLRVPVLAELQLDEVLDWTETALNRIDRAAFFESFEEHHAVQYFYEPFLEAYDPELRKQLGVWYTPREVVRYMVERVDHVLREELGIADGLAAENVYVLDPCCGTGSYVIEVIRRIAAILTEKGADALTAQEIKRAALERVYGFEILPAPFVVAHLQMGLLLRELGAPLAEQKERAGIYLTNALTGWEPPDGSKPQMILALPELMRERDAAEKVKQKKPILVILGNPPYNGFAGIAVDEEADLTKAYRTTKRAPTPQGHGLNDLYVRFYRMAERKIAEREGKGIVCFISNYSWLDGLSHPGMRERYLDCFDRIWIDSLNGDKYKTGKLTPEGKPDPSIFSTEFNREGIQVGTAITLLARREKSKGTEQVAFRELWGKEKRDQLDDEVEGRAAAAYAAFTPERGLGLSFRPGMVGSDYLSWPLLPELFPVSFPGVKTSRDELVVDIDLELLVERMEKYFDPKLPDQELRSLSPVAITDATRFEAKKVRQYLVQRGIRAEHVVEYSYRPFDIRWLYWEGETKLLDEKRAEYFPHVREGNVWLAAVQQNRKSFDAPLLTRHLSSLHVIERGANLFPLRLRLAAENEWVQNLSLKAKQYLRSTAGKAECGELSFWHLVAILYAPAYRSENASALRQDWPRIPLPASKELLEASAELGRKIAELLDPDTPVEAVTAGKLSSELSLIGLISRAGGGALDPEAGHLDVTAGWGHGGKGSPVMPGKGRALVREYSQQERNAMESAGDLGDRTVDVYLNQTAYWKNIPERVWEYTIGGYQVIKKWLSYRERSVLGRSLRPEEARAVTEMARRIGAVILLGPKLDANYSAVKAHPYQWPTGAK